MQRLVALAADPGNVIVVDALRLDVEVEPKSLAWDGDVLVDWVAGGTRYHLDGVITRAGINWAYEFDAATTLSNSPWAIIYKRLGTKALLLKDGTLVRELNRSFYHAHVYAYPVSILLTPDGRAVVAHCPDD